MEKKEERRPGRDRIGRCGIMKRGENKGSGGFSLIEVFVSMALLSVSGAALTVMLLGNSRVFLRNSQENRSVYELRAQVESGEKGIASGTSFVMIYELEATDGQVWEEELEEYRIFSEDSLAFMAYYE